MQGDPAGPRWPGLCPCPSQRGPGGAASAWVGKWAAPGEQAGEVAGPAGARLRGRPLSAQSRCLGVGVRANVLEQPPDPGRCPVPGACPHVRPRPGTDLLPLSPESTPFPPDTGATGVPGTEQATQAHRRDGLSHLSPDPGPHLPPASREGTRSQEGGSAPA